MNALMLTPWALASRRTCAATLSSSEIVVRMYEERNTAASLHHLLIDEGSVRWATNRMLEPWRTRDFRLGRWRRATEMTTKQMGEHGGVAPVEGDAAPGRADSAAAADRQ